MLSKLFFLKLPMIFILFPEVERRKHWGYSTIYSLRLRDSRDSQDSETPETPRLPRLRDSRGFCHITFQFSFISDLQQNPETPKTPSGALVLIMVYYIPSSSSRSHGSHRTLGYLVVVVQHLKLLGNVRPMMKTGMPLS